MTEPMLWRTRRLAAARGGLALVLIAAIAACATPTGSPEPSTTPSPIESPSPIPTDTPLPTATPEPALSLALPAQGDPRQVRVAVAPDVPTDGDGQILVTVTNLSDERVVELVLRWPTELKEALFLAPFAPSEARVANGGPPLRQDWTKWVEGPGERGEPAGTTSLGWGPIDPGAELRIPILVTRRANGALEFDLQLLAGEAILLLEGGEPAELRVSVP
jgi:hypothetical protein